MSQTFCCNFGKSTCTITCPDKPPDPASGVTALTVDWSGEEPDYEEIRDAHNAWMQTVMQDIANIWSMTTHGCYKSQDGKLKAFAYEPGGTAPVPCDVPEEVEEMIKTYCNDEDDDGLQMQFRKR